MDVGRTNQMIERMIKQLFRSRRVQPARLAAGLIRTLICTIIVELTFVILADLSHHFCAPPEC
jgi:hypothetical protein